MCQYGTALFSFVRQPCVKMLMKASIMSEILTIKISFTFPAFCLHTDYCVHQSFHCRTNNRSNCLHQPGRSASRLLSFSPSLLHCRHLPDTHSWEDFINTKQRGQWHSDIQPVPHWLCNIKSIYTKIFLRSQSCTTMLSGFLHNAWSKQK